MKTGENNIVVLAGGVGAARFLQGLIQFVPQENITVIINTGDDKEFYGLHVSPDIDIVLYTLAGVVEEEQGWGVTDDTFQTMKQLTFLGNDDWFMLGDRDLAMQIHRTNLMRQGKKLSGITDDTRKKFGLKLKLLPMSDEPVPTFVTTTHGTFHFEEYFVKQRFQDEVISINFKGIKKAKPAPGVLDAIKTAQTIIIAPSNPIISIGTILAVPGIRKAIKTSRAKKVAISPIVAGATIKGPADKLMKSQKLEVSPVGVTKWYQDFLDGIVIDTKDRALQNIIEKLGIQVFVTNTIMKDMQAKKILAEKTIIFANEL